MFTENETVTKIHGAIFVSHKEGKKTKVLEATRPSYVRCKEPEKPADGVGQPAYCKP